MELDYYVNGVKKMEERIYTKDEVNGYIEKAKEEVFKDLDKLGFIGSKFVTDGKEITYTELKNKHLNPPQQKKE